MTTITRFLSGAALALSLVASTATIILGEASGGGSRASIPLLMASVMFVVVGTVIVNKQPKNAIGWIFCGIGIIWTTGAVAVEFSVFATVGRSEDLRGAVAAAWYGEWNWIPFWFLTLVVTPTLFPTGRAPSRRWATFLRLAVGAVAAMTVVVALDPILDIEGTGEKLTNPIGIAGATWLDPDDRESLSSILLFPVLFGSAAAAGASMVTRFRRARGEERLQLKWFAFATVVMVTGWFALALTVSTGPIAGAYGLLVGLVPIAAGIAILRYRLYNIDVLINRTLVYGALTAALLGLYLLIVIVVSRVLDPITRDSDLAVAASTLAVAALFRPLRARIQGFIDRRFYRAKYDATRAVATFAARLRDEIEVESVRSGVLGVVTETVQPRHVSLWVRSRETA